MVKLIGLQLYRWSTSPIVIFVTCSYQLETLWRKVSHVASQVVISERHSGEKLSLVWTAFYLSFISASECEWFTPQSTWRLRDTSPCLSVSLNQDHVIKIPWKGTEIGLGGLKYARMCHHSFECWICTLPVVQGPSTSERTSSHWYQ